MRTWSEFSAEFYSLHPELYDRYLVKAIVTSDKEYVFEFYSDQTIDDILQTIKGDLGQKEFTIRFEIEF